MSWLLWLFQFVLWHLSSGSTIVPLWKLPALPAPGGKHQCYYLVCWKKVSGVFWAMKSLRCSSPTVSPYLPPSLPPSNFQPLINPQYTQPHSELGILRKIPVPYICCQYVPWIRGALPVSPVFPPWKIPLNARRGEIWPALAFDLQVVCMKFIGSPGQRQACHLAFLWNRAYLNSDTWFQEDLLASTGK